MEGMYGVFREKTEVPSSNPLHGRWKSLEIPPELGRCAVHLKLCERTVRLGFQHFRN